MNSRLGRIRAYPLEGTPLFATADARPHPYHPLGGIGGSAIIHFVGLWLVLMSPFRHLALEQPEVPPDPEQGDFIVIFLPPVGGGSEGAGTSQQGPPSPETNVAEGEAGMLFPGPQLIRSESPKPTDLAQTLLQPDRPDLPDLEKEVQLPNLVAMRETVVTQEPEPQTPQNEQALEPEPPPPTPIAAVELPPDPRPAPDPSQLDDPFYAPIAKPAPVPPPPTSVEELDVRPMDFQAKLVPSPLGGLGPMFVQPKPVEPPDPFALVENRIEQLPIERETEDTRDPLAAADPTLAPQPKPALAQTDIEDLPLDRRRADRPQSAILPEPTLAPQPEPVDPKLEALERLMRNQLSDLPLERRADEVDNAALVPEAVQDLPNLLALSPTPTPIEDIEEIPAAEARGQFTISPEATPNAGETRPGIVGTGATTEKADSPIVSVTFGAAGNEGGGPGGGEGGKGAGSEPGTGTGPGAGSATGPGRGSGTGKGTGTGSGAGSGPGTGPFPGVTIVGGLPEATGSVASSNATGSAGGGIRVVGGFGGTGTDPARRVPDEPFSDRVRIGGSDDSARERSPVTMNRPLTPLRNDYGLFILSGNENSGGGLPYVGVFSDDQVHTVYLDMREFPSQTNPNWVFEFAIPSRTISQAPSAGGIANVGQGFQLPLPVIKELPLLPADVVARHQGQLYIVYGVINLDGKLDQLEVKQSPDERLDAPILETLGKWLFKAGSLDGEPVETRVLIGIPIWRENG